MRPLAWETSGLLHIRIHTYTQVAGVDELCQEKLRSVAAYLHFREVPQKEKQAVRSVRSDARTLASGVEEKETGNPYSCLIKFRACSC